MISVVFRDFSNDFSTSSKRCPVSSPTSVVVTVSPASLLFSTSGGEATPFGTVFVPRLNSTTGWTSAVSELISVRARYVMRKKMPKATRMP